MSMSVQTHVEIAEIAFVFVSVIYLGHVSISLSPSLSLCRSVCLFLSLKAKILRSNRDRVIYFQKC